MLFSETLLEKMNKYLNPTDATAGSAGAGVDTPDTPFSAGNGDGLQAVHLGPLAPRRTHYVPVDASVMSVNLLCSVCETGLSLLNATMTTTRSKREVNLKALHKAATSTRANAVAK